MTMIEIVIYSVLLAIIVAAVVSLLITLGSTYRSLQSTETIGTSAQTALERMTREIRAATSVDMGQSTLDLSPGQLTLNTLDDSGSATTIQFFVLNGAIRVKEAGVDSGPLTSASVRVSNLIFRRSTTAQSQAVKIELTLESGEGVAFASHLFYATIVLRGSYPLQ